MHEKVNRYKLRNLGLALCVSMLLGMILQMTPWENYFLEIVPAESTIAPYRYVLGLLAGALALVAAKFGRGYLVILIGEIILLAVCIALTYVEYHRKIDALIDLNLFLQGIIIYELWKIRKDIWMWQKIVQAEPLVLDLRIDGKKDLFSRLVIAPHVMMNPEITSAVDYFLGISGENAPLSLCIHTVEPIAEHVQQITLEAYQMYYEDEERKAINFIQSRYARAIWMIVISVSAFRLLSQMSSQNDVAVIWEILGNFAAFSLWKVGDTLLETSEAMHRLKLVLIAKYADLQFL